MAERALLRKFVTTLTRSGYPRRSFNASFNHASLIGDGPDLDQSLSQDRTTQKMLVRTDRTRRSFSSKETHTSNSDDTLEARWRDSTARVLDLQTHQIGSFDTLTWQLCVTLLLWWVEKIGHEGVEMSLSLLDRLVDEAAAAAPTKNFKLDIYILHAVVKNWNNNFRQFKTNILPSTMASRIDGYLEKSDCLQPNIVTYTMILDGASHCPIPQERLVFTEQLLQRLIQESESNPHLRPTVVTFGTVINAMAQSGNLQSAEKAEAMLRRLQDLHSKEDCWRDVKPNAVLYTTVIHAWAKAGNVHRAESLLKEMYEECTLHGNADLKPNRRTFNSVLATWSKDASPTAGESAEALLRKMRDLYDKGTLDTNPDVVTYNCVINAMANKPNNHDAVDKAEALVKEMIELSIAPNQITFTALIRTIARSAVKDKAPRAQNVLRLMEEQGVPPSVYILDKVGQLEDDA